VPSPFRALTRRVAACAAVAALATGVLAVGGATPVAAEVRPICFPVLEPLAATLTNTFGAPRGGGRSHEGNDLMGHKLDHVLSATDGTVVDVRWSGNGSTEHTIRVQGDDGYFYAYLHLNNDTPGTDDGRAGWSDIFAVGIGVGARVHAGQMLGYMGDSGNAEGAGPHLHFEIRQSQPGGNVWNSVAIDPYPSLQAATTCPVVSPTRPYTGLGGILRGDPDATATDAGVVEVFGRGADDQLYARTWDGSTYTGWTALGGILRSGPGVVASPGDRLDVFVRGRDDQLWTNTRSGGVWQGWQPLGGIITAEPDATVTADGQIVVLVRGADQGLWYRVLGPGGWSGWLTAAGGTPSGPTAVGTGPGRFEIYIRGLDNQLWRREITPTGLGDWAPLGGIATSGPDAVATSGGVRVMVRGVDLRLWERSGDAWALASGNSAGGGPAVAVDPGGDRAVFVDGPDAALYHVVRAAAGW
jgi:hypothetical protein